ncbi:hypothetical protein PG996_007306 [Apiospora saccharicola]|uniref:Uncharacterized protein n=1 Tax=Apiospora saccharicola TaxID=335842 RepID=A0ABR1VDW0_9PEZI
MGATILHRLWLIAALLAVRVVADCASYGVDFANGGSYNIDGSSNENFSFTTIFQGCAEESITPVLRDSDENSYVCSAINTMPEGTSVTSTCGIPYSQMRTGQWRIILSGRQLAVQRVINLTVGKPETVVITATPTITIGITSTPEAITVIATRTITQTLILPPQTVTTPCNRPTYTVTITPTPPTVIRTSTAVRTETDRTVTSSVYVTITRSAYCHFPTSKTTTAKWPPWPAATANNANARQDATDVQDAPLQIKAPEPPAPTDFAPLAATTITVTETTYTVTLTSVTTLPAATTTETSTRTNTATISALCAWAHQTCFPTNSDPVEIKMADTSPHSTPPPSTVCGGPGGPDKTVTITRPYSTVFLTTVTYSTTHVTGTVTVGIYASEAIDSMYVISDQHMTST